MARTPHHRLLTGTLVAVSAAALTAPADASFKLADPANITTADINSNGNTIDKSAGNISLTDFNALDTTYVCTLDTPQTEFTNTSVPIFLQLTSGTSGIDLNATISASGGGYAVFAESATYASSGLGNMTTNRATITIDINEGVAGVAFTLNRLIGDATVTLFDADSNAVGAASGYTLSEGASHGYFGFLGGGSDNAISQVVITTAGGNALGLDDVSFTNVPEPATLGLLASGLALVVARRRRRAG